MKKKYVRPRIVVVNPHVEPLLNGGSVVDYNGNYQDGLGSDTTTGGQEGDGGYVWGDAKQNDTWGTIWEE